MEDKRWSKKVEGGILIEDDGGFVNFFPTKPSFDPGMCLGWGLDDDEDEAPTEVPSVPQEEKDNVIDFIAYKKKRGLL